MTRGRIEQLSCFPLVHDASFVTVQLVGNPSWSMLIRLVLSWPQHDLCDSGEPRTKTSIELIPLFMSRTCLPCAVVSLLFCSTRQYEKGPFDTFTVEHKKVRSRAAVLQIHGMFLS